MKIIIILCCLWVLYSQQFLLNKTKNIINEIFRDNQIKLNKIPFADEVALNTFQVLKLDLAFQQSYTLITRAQIDISISGLFTLKGEIELEAKFSWDLHLEFKTIIIKTHNVDGIVNRMVASIAETKVNQFLQKFCNKPIGFSLPEYVKLIEKNEDSSTNGIVLDYNAYVQQRRKLKTPQEPVQQQYRPQPQSASPQQQTL